MFFDRRYAASTLCVQAMKRSASGVRSHAGVMEEVAFPAILVQAFKGSGISGSIAFRAALFVHSICRQEAAGYNEISWTTQ
jgi:hypothetical protein